uniref:SMG9 nonsense mediated mRNA decay factor n=1 Tax=Salarias fasciatus TaxID=181472 RepID=A0A672HX38_SALFA
AEEAVKADLRANLSGCFHVGQDRFDPGDLTFLFKNKNYLSYRKKEFRKKISRLCQRYSKYHSPSLSVCFLVLKTDPAGFSDRLSFSLQPMLSPSILDHLINNDRKLSPEYNLPHTCIEMQSLQIAAFLFTVCHVVIVVQDWFTDLNLYKFLQTAEMLKPSTPSASHDSTGSSGSDDGAEYYPHIAFLQNKAGRDDFSPRKLKNMHLVVDKLMAHSHLKYKGAAAAYYRFFFPGLGVFFFFFFFGGGGGGGGGSVLGSGTYPLFSLLPGYRGHPSFPTMISKLCSQILAMPHCQLSHTILTEKNWFHYAARIWDGVKKSSALSEYSRLLC